MTGREVFVTPTADGGTAEYQGLLAGQPVSLEAGPLKQDVPLGAQEATLELP